MDDALTLGEIMTLVAHAAGTADSCAFSINGPDALPRASFMCGPDTIAVTLMPNHAPKFESIDEECLVLARALVNSIDFFNDENYDDMGVIARVVGAETRMDASSNACMRLSICLQSSCGALETSMPTSPLVLQALLNDLKPPCTLQCVQLHIAVIEHDMFCPADFVPYILPALFMFMQRALQDVPACVCVFANGVSVACAGTRFRPPGVLAKRRRVSTSGFADTDTYALCYDQDEIDSAALLHAKTRVVN